MAFCWPAAWQRLWRQGEAKRDAQIADLKKWYRDTEAMLTWDETQHKRVLKPAAGVTD